MGRQAALARELRPLQLDALPDASVPTPMARSGNAVPSAPAPGAPPQSPSRGLVQVRRVGGRVGSEVTSTQLKSLAPRLGRGDPGHPGVSRLDPEQQWGPFSAWAGESPYGGV